MVEDTPKLHLPSLEGLGSEPVLVDATASVEDFRAVEEGDSHLAVTAASEEELLAEVVETLAVPAVIVALVSRMGSTRPLTPRLVLTGLDVADLAEAIRIAVDQVVVGMTRATAVAHMMIDQADIVTEVDSAIVTAEAALTLSRFVADESIATSTGREKTTAENVALKATTRIHENYDVTKTRSFRFETRVVCLGGYLHVFHILLLPLQPFRLFPSAFRHQG